MASTDIVYGSPSARRQGAFAWPVHARREGTCSSIAAEILGDTVRSIDQFVRILDPGYAGSFVASIKKSEDFRMTLRLQNQHHIDVSILFPDEAGERKLLGSVEALATGDGIPQSIDIREELIRAMAENSPAMLWMGDEHGKCEFLNTAQRTFWGVDPVDLSQFDWSTTLHPQDIEKLGAVFVRSMTQQIPFEVEARYLRADGEYRTLLTKANPRFHPSTGAFQGMTGVNTDITERLAAEAQTRVLMGELNHRTKNILTVVQAIARQTAKHADPDEFQAVLGRRIAGLAASNDLLLKNDWSGVRLSELLDAQLDHLKDLFGTRILTRGPDLTIAATAAQTLGMAFHELATNSLKYGALSTPGSKVSIEWERGDERCPFTISWVEAGAGNGKPLDHRGFGSTVIVDMVESVLDAAVEVSLSDGEFAWNVKARSRKGLAD